MKGVRLPASTPRAIEVAALELFTTLGFEETTVHQIAAAAGVSRRAFFRFFPSKGAVLWWSFNQRLERACAHLDAVPPDQPIMPAVLASIVQAHRDCEDDIEVWRARCALVASSVTLQAAGLLHIRAWEEAIAGFVARRTGSQPTDLVPMAVGRTACAVSRAAFDGWIACPEADYAHYVDAALAAASTALSAALDPDDWSAPRTDRPS